MKTLGSGRGTRASARAYRGMAATLAVGLGLLVVQSSAAVQPGPVRIAVFNFDLSDKSAAGGVLAADAIDTENLKSSAQQARDLLAASGRYSIVDTAAAEAEVTSAGGVLKCQACDVPLAKELGAEQSMVGVVTRVSRAEYTIQIVVTDTETGKTVSNNFSGLRMGANYSWPRGVKSLVNRMLAAPAP